VKARSCDPLKRGQKIFKMGEKLGKKGLRHDSQYSGGLLVEGTGARLLWVGGSGLEVSEGK